MKTKTTLIIMSILLLGSAQSLKAQRANIWYFGDHAGLDFTSGAPVEIFNSSLYSNEGCATLCDTAGNLLMYTNGGPYSVTEQAAIWNANDSVMPNGDLTNASGCYSSAQSSIIIPHPGNGSQYYVFTTDCQEHGMAGGFRFNLVDMTLDGGLGDVIVKDSFLIASVNESIAGILHANGTDYWVVTHGVANTEFYVFLVTATGISAPTTYTVGNVAYQSSGQLSANCSGTKLAYAATSFAYLFDFDNSTGAITNFVNLNFDAFGCAFSPSGRYLYMASQNISAGNVMQYDLAAANVAASGVLVGTNSGFAFFCNMGLGPDHKIYMSRYNANALGVISDPDLAGVACNFSATGLPLTNASIGGLPNFVNTFTGTCTTTGLGSINSMQASVVYNWYQKQISIYFTKAVNANIVLHDALGRIVCEHNINNTSEAVIDASTLAKGVYLLSFFDKSGKAGERKVIVY